MDGNNYILDFWFLDHEIEKHFLLFLYLLTLYVVVYIKFDKTKE